MFITYLHIVVDMIYIGFYKDPWNWIMKPGKSLNDTHVKNLKKFNPIFIIFSFIWLYLQNNNGYLFDIDKLRGFSNSSSSYLSNIYWFITLLLLINGIYFLSKKTDIKINQNRLIFNFLISGSLVVIFGII